jgi:hypothetical protein
MEVFCQERVLPLVPWVTVAASRADGTVTGTPACSAREGSDVASAIGVQPWRPSSLHVQRTAGGHGAQTEAGRWSPRARAAALTSCISDLNLAASWWPSTMRAR